MQSTLFDRKLWVWAKACDTEVMMQTKVWTCCGLTRQLVCVFVKEAADLLLKHKPCWKHFLSKLHIDPADETFSSCRGGTSLLAATYDPPSPNTLTKAPPGNTSPFSLQSLISFHQVCLFPFSLRTFLLSWMLLFVSNPIALSIPASLYPAFLHLCLLCIILPPSTSVAVSKILPPPHHYSAPKAMVSMLKWFLNIRLQHRGLKVSHSASSECTTNTDSLNISYNSRSKDIWCNQKTRQKRYLEKWKRLVEKDVGMFIRNMYRYIFWCF